MMLVNAPIPSAALERESDHYQVLEFCICVLGTACLPPTVSSCSPIWTRWHLPRTRCHMCRDSLVRQSSFWGICIKTRARQVLQGIASLTGVALQGSKQGVDVPD